MFKKLNNEIQSQWAFFGPKWWCWLLVLLGSIPWLIEGPFKAFGYAKYGPGFQVIEYISYVYNSNNYIYFFVLVVVFCLPMMSAMIYFPSFMFLFARIVIEHYNPKGNKIYIIYLLVLTFPVWFNFLLSSNVFQQIIN